MRVIQLRCFVKDFEVWRPGYDDDKGIRESYGLTDVELLTNPDNQNEITIILEESNLGGFERFSEDSQLKERMEAYGVIGEPDLKFYKKEE